MWTADNCPRYNRDKRHYPGDLTGEEWTLVTPLILPAKRGGRRLSVDVLEVVNGLLYVLSTGCQWRYVPRICRQRARSTTILTLDLSSRDRPHPSRALHTMLRKAGARGKSDRLHHR